MNGFARELASTRYQKSAKPVEEQFKNKTTRNLAGNTILMTGGASEMGLALAGRFLADGSTVISSGRREDKLLEARQHPGLHTREADVGGEANRIALFEWVQQASRTELHEIFKRRNPI